MTYVFSREICFDIAMDLMELIISEEMVQPRPPTRIEYDKEF